MDRIPHQLRRNRVATTTMTNRTARTGATSSILTVGGVLLLFLLLSTNTFGAAQAVVQLFSTIGNGLGQGFSFIRQGLGA